MRRFASTLASTLLFAGIAAALAGPAGAQTVTIPPGQTCGGLLCDAGIFGHRVPVGPKGEAPTAEQVAAVEAADPHHLPCNDFFCRAFGGKPAAAPPPLAPVAAEPVAAEPKTRAARIKKKRPARTAASEPAKPAAEPPQ